VTPLVKPANVAVALAFHHELIHHAVVLEVFLQNSYCTHPTPASVAVLLVTVFVVHGVYGGSVVIVSGLGIGGVASTTNVFTLNVLL